jgi:hypothetical protein
MASFFSYNLLCLSDSKENQLKQKKKEEEEKEKAIRRVCVQPARFSPINLKSIQSTGCFLAFPHPQHSPYSTLPSSY